MRFGIDVLRPTFSDEKREQSRRKKGRNDGRAVIVLVK
ncbi:hypothetical protein M080_6667 [Bacteroides fragilis str. 3397 T10]|nr:hypothetical protein M080_6667 [Bacteroides fragilis str. 3397 T10]